MTYAPPSQLRVRISQELSRCRWRRYRGLVRVIAFSIVVACTAMVSMAGTPPRAGYSKVELGYLGTVPNASAPPLLALPNASDPANIASDVPFDILEEYSGRYPYWISWIISVKSDLMDRLRTLAPAGMDVRGRSYLDSVYLAGTSYDTRQPFTPATLGLPAANYADGQFGLYVVQYHGWPKEEWIQLLRDTGAIYYWSIYQNNVLVAATPAVAARVADLPFVQWSTPLHPYLKDAPFAYEYSQGVVHNATVYVLRMPGSETAESTAVQLCQSGSSCSCGPVDPAYDFIDVCSGSWSLSSVAALLEQPSVLEIHRSTGNQPSPPPSGEPPVYVSIPALSAVGIAALALILAIVALRRAG